MDLSALPRRTKCRIEETRNRRAFLDDNDRYQLPGVRIFMKHVEPVLQNGPQCGLVALEMASVMLDLDILIDTPGIYTIGKGLGFTNHGEMFSTEWMAQLALHMWPTAVTATVIDFPSSSQLADHIHNGSAILVPYDCDRNHEPSMDKGERAHWALITGFLFTTFKQRDIQPATLPLCSDFYFDNDFLVVCMHGKSTFPAFWEFNNLRDSNAQLEVVRDYPRPMIVPEGGMQLKNTCVVLSKR